MPDGEGDENVARDEEGAVDPVAAPGAKGEGEQEIGEGRRRRGKMREWFDSIWGREDSAASSSLPASLPFFLLNALCFKIGRLMVLHSRHPSKKGANGHLEL